MEYLDAHYVSYDSDGRVSSETYRINKTAIADTLSDGYTTYYSYNDDGSIWKEYSSTGDMRIDTEYTYDDLNRLSDVYRYSPGGFEYEEHYTYVSNGTSTSPLVSTYCVYVTNGDIWYGHEDEYFYDENGNLSIAAFERQTDYPVVYMYDDLSQLTFVEDFYNTIVYSYTYDNAGNIIKAEYGSLDGHTTNVYSYTDIRSGDILTAFNGVPITYDAIGNPLSYYNGSSYTFTWEGRRLVGAVSGGKTYSFTYNDEGIRTSKTVNGVEHKYYLSGSRIMAEEWEENLLVFVYDSKGSPIGMMYRMDGFSEGLWENYWFEKNMWGDITAIYDDAGNLIIEYKYDPWGNCTEEQLMNSYGAQYNPFRYRGYYYDADLGLYYLNARYYDSNTCRFISPDKYISTGQGLIGYNMYAYCGNNPVMRVDPTGNAWYHWAIGAAIVVACGAATVITCGGFAAAATAVSMVGSGVAAATTASTIAAGAFIGSATVYGMAALSAASTSNSLQEFSDQGNWGTVGATAGGAVVGGAYAYISAQASTTKIYRSVSSAEAQNIKDTGRFNLSPNGMECKQFGFNLEEIRQFGNIMGQDIIVSAKVPKSMLNLFYTGGVDTSIFRSGTLTVYGDQLDMFNQIVSDTIKILP